MKTIIALLMLTLPCSALAGELRIVRCTDGTAAVQELAVDPFYEGPNWREVQAWRTISGCHPLEAARRLRDEELAWRNRPPAPAVKEPVEVVE